MHDFGSHTFIKCSLVQQRVQKNSMIQSICCLRGFLRTAKEYMWQKLPLNVFQSIHWRANTKGSFCLEILLLNVCYLPVINCKKNYNSDVYFIIFIFYSFFDRWNYYKPWSWLASYVWPNCFKISHACLSTASLYWVCWCWPSLWLLIGSPASGTWLVSSKQGSLIWVSYDWLARITIR